MTQTAGYLGVFSVATTPSGTYNTVASIKSVSSGIEREAVSTTAIAQTSPGGESAILGKFKGKCTVKGDYDMTDTSGQKVLRDALLTGSGLVYCQVQVAPSASAGLKGIKFKALVTGMPLDISSGSNTGEVSFDIMVQDKVVDDNTTPPT